MNGFPGRLFCSIPLLLAFAGNGSLASSATPAPTRETPAYSTLAQLELPALKAALEKAGWPPEHVQAFISTETQARFNPPPKLQPADIRPFEFWRTGPDTLPLPRISDAEREARQQRAVLARQKFRELYPHDDAESGLLHDWETTRRWGDLPAEKRARIERILEEANVARDAFLKAHGSHLRPEEWKTIWSINRKARERTAAELSPEELLDYDLRNSQTANQMREELDVFRPSREEFMKIFRLRHPLELAFDDKPEGIDETIDQKRRDATATVQREISAALGPARYEDYKLSLDPECQALQVSARSGTSDAAAVRDVYRTLVRTREKLQELNSRPTPETETTARRMREELFARFQHVLGEAAARRWLKEQGLWP